MIFGAASLCQSTGEALDLLNALYDVGFPLPIRLLTESSEALISGVDTLLEGLRVLEDSSSF